MRLHLTERYTRVDRDQLNYEVTIEDPKVLTKPFTQRTTLMLREGARLREYSCAENNMDPGVYEKMLKDPTASQSFIRGKYALALGFGLWASWEPEAESPEPRALGSV